MPAGASPAPPPPPRSKVKRKAPKPPVQQPFADDPYGQGIPGANPYGFTSYDPDQAAPYEDAFDEQPVGGSGFAAVNAARQAVEDEALINDEQPEEDDEATMEPPVEEAPQKPHILESEPETVIGETLQIEGTLRFERLLRLDGKFEGDLVSTGDLIVGPRGELVGDVRDMADLVVFGKVIGNINVDHLELCGAASIYGDVTCKTLLMDPTVVLVGTLNVNPFAPNLMDRNGDEVPPEGAGVVPTSPPTSPAKEPAEAPAAAPPVDDPPASARSEPEATPAVEPAAPSPVKAPEPAKSPEKPAEPEPVPSPAKSPAKEPAPEPTEAPPASPAKAAPAPEPVAEPAKAPEPEPAAAAEPAKSPEKPAPAEQVGGAPPAADTSDAPAEAAKSPAKPAEPAAAEPAAEPTCRARAEVLGGRALKIRPPRASLAGEEGTGKE